MRHVYSTHEAARLLGVDAHTVARWVDRGLLAAEVTAGGHRRISASALRRFLADRGRSIPQELRDSPAKLLVIDDSPKLLDAFQRVLRQIAPAIRVLVAGSGSEGLLKLGLELPDAAVVDVCLPDIDGIEFCRTVRAEERLAAIQLVCVSGHWTSERRQAARASGVVDCLDKPLDAAQLLGIVGRACASKYGAV